MPAISVIVPVYKVEPFLNRCMDSILAQTYADFEILATDDGTPDRSGEICDEYALEDDRVLLIHKPNGGVSVARNTALALAVGVYVTFVDSDDWVRTDMLGGMYGVICQTDSDTVVCGSEVILTDGTTKENYLPEKGAITGVEALNRYSELGNSVIHTPWNKLVKRTIVAAHPFPVGRTYSEDFATVYKWLYDSKRVAAFDQACYCYYLSDTGTSRQSGKYLRRDQYIQNSRTYDEIDDFAQAHGLNLFGNAMMEERVAIDVYMSVWSDCGFKPFFRADYLKCCFRVWRNRRPFPGNRADFWQVLFPKATRLYCHLSAMKKMLRNKGLLATAKRLFKGKEC